MRHFFLILCIVIGNITFIEAQEDSYSINDTILKTLPENVTIVGLGDPTHQESTITTYRIDLIKKLVVEKGYKIIAIEGNMYELYKAHQRFVKDNDISNYENAMYRMFNAKEMEALYSFVYEQNKKGNEVKFLGFDPAFSGVSFAKNITEDLEQVTVLSQEEKNDFIKYIEKANIANLSALFRNNKKVKRKIIDYSEKILATFKPKNKDDYFFCEALKNMIFLFEDKPNTPYDGDDKRDIGMCMNFDFIRSHYPEEKVVLFGSSTHLLKKPKSIPLPFYQNNRITFANQLFEKYKDNYFYIAYTSLSGTKYNYLNKSKPKTIPEAIENSIEYKINQEFDVTAKYITQKTYPSESRIESRFMGHSFTPLYLWEVIDGLVLIHEVKPFEIKEIDEHK
ncbi:erythromycin esterase family protein [Flavobacterium sp.]|uniref:erythromycin esterase family protein n=1 Tax=Flavobacterium sp. TaxID=239 RepID=UPI004048E86F